jgi:hypothetical protein
MGPTLFSIEAAIVPQVVGLRKAITAAKQVKVLEGGEVTNFWKFSGSRVLEVERGCEDLIASRC